MKAKVKLKIKYEGPIAFSKESLFDYNSLARTSLDSELSLFLFNIKFLSQSISYWDTSNYEITT